MFRWDVLAPCTDFIPILGLRPLQPSSWFWTPVLGATKVVISGIYGAHYKHGSLIPHEFSITTLALLTCGCMYVGTLGHIPRHTGQTSLKIIIIILT